ncbi:MAG: hypothetical protein WC788_05610 [Candidatus Paceibacterota bacterium]|jgi:hypothetical protein
MSDKNKNTSSFGPLSIFAVIMLTLIGTLFGAVSFLSSRYFSAINYPEYDAKAAVESTEAGTEPKSPEIPAEAKWTTYANDNYGFSFRHPEDWRITKDLFSKSFILTATNKTYASETSGEIRIEALSEDEVNTVKYMNYDTAGDGTVYAYETTFSHMINLAGKEKKEFIRFHYLELGANGINIPKDDWKYFDIYKKITESFAFVR